MTAATSDFGSAKPTLRGVSHQWAFFVALAATALLVASTRTTRQALAAAVYGATLSALFGISALYHRRHWGPEQRQLMRRLDHSAIYLFIAGAYTPLFWLLDGAPHRPLLVVWACALVGVTKTLLWTNAPKPLSAALYVAMGWAVIGDVVRLSHAMGKEATWLLVASGVVFSLGALVYARRRPDPIPRVFGYHEIFHAIVILGTMVHFAHVVRVLAAAG